MMECEHVFVRHPMLGEMKSNWKHCRHCRMLFFVVEDSVVV